MSESNDNGGVKNPPKNGRRKKAGSTAVMEPQTRILISAAESGLTWARAKRMTKVQLPGTDEFSATVENVDYAIHFKPSPIEGSPEAAGGSSALITPKLAEEMGIEFDELCEQFTKMDRYGLDYAFLDDKPNADKILTRMQHRAENYHRNLQVAMSEGIYKSDMVIQTED